MSEEKKQDPWLNYILYLCVIVIAYFGVAYFFGSSLARGWWFWQGVKADVIHLFLSTNELNQIVEMTNQKRNWNKVSILDSLILANYVNGYWRWITVPFIAYWAYLIAKANPLKKITHRHSMKTLLESEVSVWKHIQPIVSLDIMNAQTDKGGWAVSKKPLEFAKDFNLLKEGTELDKEKAHKVFSSQLNQVWAGTEKMPMLTKAFFAIFAAAGNWDETNQKYKSAKNDARKALDALAQSFYKNPKRLDYSWVDGLLKTHQDHPNVKAITQKHAYTHTVMMSMLEYARRNGVLPSSEFFWLRPVDRKLWYVLNNVGRNVAWTEVAGIYGHWLAEKVNEGPIMRPYVQKAIEAMAESLKNTKLERD